MTVLIFFWALIYFFPGSSQQFLPLLPAVLLVSAAVLPSFSILLSLINGVVLAAAILLLPCYPWCMTAAAASGIAGSLLILLLTKRAARYRKYRDEDVLVIEMRHRMKNDFQFVSSLLSLEGRKVSDPESREVFSNCQERIFALSSVQDFLLCRGRSEIDFPQYAAQLIKRLSDSQVGNKHVEMKVKIDKVSVTVREAETLGLIINEAVTNAIKYAFQEDTPEDPEIIIMCRYLPGNVIRLCIRDNGKGIDNTCKSREGIGLDLIRVLAEDRLNGKIGINGEAGTNIFVEFQSKTSTGTS
ncbi:MAG: sensor histidine kinase [Spirochaetia bacterium]